LLTLSKTSHEKTRKPMSFGPRPRSFNRPRYITEDFTKPLSSKAKLPVQIVIGKDRKPYLKRELADGRIYHDPSLPNLPGRDRKFIS
jgi:hypothetical protein